MSDDNIIKLQNVIEITVPEAKRRSGKITLHYNVEDHDTVEIEGSITLSEACFLMTRLQHYLQSQMDDLND